MSEHQVSSVSYSEPNVERREELPPPPDDGDRASTSAQPPPASAPRSRWTAGRVTALVIGALLALVSLCLLAAAAMGLWYDRTQREAGFVTTDAHEFSTSGSALTTEPVELGSAGFGWLYAPGMLDEVRIRVRPAATDSPVFVGIADSADVDRYLAGVSHTVVSDFWSDDVEAVAGDTPPSAPDAQSFWVADANGVGSQTVTWDPVDGSWTVVVMNADGSPGIDVETDLGARMPALPWIALGVLAAGAVFMAGGVLLIVGAARRRAADVPRA